MKPIFYLMGIVVLVVIFGFVMIKGASVGQDSIYIAQINDGIQEITLGVKDFNYYPNIVKVKSGIPVRIYLDSSVSGCLRDFTVRDFEIHEYLKTPEDYVEFTPAETGRHTFACSMGMGTGVLIVE